MKVLWVFLSPFFTNIVLSNLILFGKRAVILVHLLHNQYWRKLDIKHIQKTVGGVV